MNVQKDEQQRRCNTTDRPSVWWSEMANQIIVVSTDRLMKKHHLHEACCARALVDLAVMMGASKNITLHHQAVVQPHYVQNYVSGCGARIPRKDYLAMPYVAPSKPE